MNPEADAAEQIARYEAAKRVNPDLLPYVGPEDTLNRFLAGEIVTKNDLLTDQSLWTVQPILSAQLRRLKWMVEL